VGDVDPEVLAELRAALARSREAAERVTPEERERQEREVEQRHAEMWARWQNRSLRLLPASRLKFPEIEPAVLEPIPVRVVDDSEELTSSRPRHRPPRGVSVEIARELDVLLERRAADPANGALSQEAIATHLKISRKLVRKAIALHRVGWPLARSDPDFGPERAKGGFVYWPNPEKALQILASD